MDIFGVGPLEIFFILLIALIVLGPKDMVKAGRTLGRFMRNVVKSETWSAIRHTAREVRTLPTRLMREAGAEDLPQTLADVRNDLAGADPNRDLQDWSRGLVDWTDPPPRITPPRNNTPAQAGSQGDSPKPLADSEVDRSDPFADWSTPPTQTPAAATDQEITPPSPPAE